MLIGDLTNSYFGELLGQVEGFAADAGFSIILSNARLGPEEEIARLESLFEQRVSGVLLCQYSGAAEVEELLAASPVPVVAASCRSGVCDSACTDDRAAERIATEHLLGLGHRRSALVLDCATDAQTNDERSLGYEDARRQAGLDPDPELRFAWDFRGRKAAEAAVADAVVAKGGPTALVATSDDAAISVIDALEARGRPVPGTLSVVGYDGVAIGAHERIALTTMAQPSRLIAARAVEMLEGRIAGETGPPAQSLFESELVVRHSTAPPVGA
ncbi:MAG: LacI family DNA-binding transcriptional regulator [Ilumatobacteraceae bacterium]